MTSSLEVVDPQEDHQNFVKHSHSWVVKGGGPLSDVFLVLKYQECALVVGSFMDNLHVTSTVVQGVLRGFDPNLVARLVAPVLPVDLRIIEACGHASVRHRQMLVAMVLLNFQCRSKGCFAATDAFILL